MVVEEECYKCPYCKQTYKSFSDALDCAKECVNVEDPVNATRYKCEMCNCEYNKEVDASICESKHSDQLDKHYEAYIYKKGFDALMTASRKTGQLKIGEGTW